MNSELQEQYFGHQHVTVIEPTKGWRMLDWFTIVILRACNG